MLPNGDVCLWPAWVTKFCFLLLYMQKKNTVASNKVGQRSETFSLCQCHCRFGSQEAGCTEDPLLEPIADLSFQAGKVPLLKITTSFCDSTNVKCISVCPPVDCAYYHSAVDFFTQHKKYQVFWEIWQILVIEITKQIIYLLSGDGRSKISPLIQT